MSSTSRNESSVRRSSSFHQSPNTKVARPVVTGESKMLCSAQKIQKILTCGLCKCELRYPTVCLNCNLLVYACEDCYRKETGSPECSVNDTESLVQCPWMKHILDVGNVCYKSTERDALSTTRALVGCRLNELRSQQVELKTLLLKARESLPRILEKSEKLDGSILDLRRVLCRIEPLCGYNGK